jgi:copper(I)-binding protein
MSRSAILALAALAGALLVSPYAAHARDYRVGTLDIVDPWIRAPPDAAPTAAGYLSVVNRGKTADRLLGGATPLAAAVEPHTMSMSGGVMRMRLAANGFEIPPGATLTLAPGGSHLMLIGPKRPLKVGESVPVTLRFAGAGTARVEFAVRSGQAGR